MLSKARDLYVLGGLNGGLVKVEKVKENSRVVVGYKAVMRKD